MSKKMWFLMVVCGFCSMVVYSPESRAANAETEKLLELLQKKAVISEEEAVAFRENVEIKPEERQKDHRHSVQSLADRMDYLEKLREQEVSAGIAGMLRFSGFVEVEMQSEKLREAATGNETATSDIALATAQLDVDVEINPHVLAHMAFLYEEGSEFTVDEGTISLAGGDRLPLYINAGKMVVPFGRYESHFISDPLTLVMGETNDAAVIAGFANDMLDVNVGAFRGLVKETGADDRINSFVASASLTLPAIVPAAEIETGVSYISNIATSDSLQSTDGSGVSSETVAEYVEGVSGFVHVVVKQRFSFDAEYVGAFDHFTPADLDFAGGEALKPATWNFEAGWRVTEPLEIAVKYEGSREFGNVVPEKQYGLALAMEILPQTVLIGEYLAGEFDNGDERDLFTLQLAVSF